MYQTTLVKGSWVTCVMIVGVREIRYLMIRFDNSCCGILSKESRSKLQYFKNLDMQYS